MGCWRRLVCACGLRSSRALSAGICAGLEPAVGSLFPVFLMVVSLPKLQLSGGCGPDSIHK